MKVQYCSDLHLEFESNSQYLLKNPLPIIGDVLILAGDIIPLQDGFANHPFFSYVANNFKQTIWVPGNHEFYNQHADRYGPSYTIALKNNLRLVHNSDIVIDGIRFACTTLWSKIRAENEKRIRQNVADFSCILLKNSEITVQGFNDLHRTSLNYLQNALTQNNQGLVVVTHHLPSSQCNSQEHAQSPINDAFCAELTETILQTSANFWIHGHSHHNYYPLLMGRTFMLTNQLGYVDQNEHTTFKPEAYFSI
jgi:Icc-related predicted phosphoesterase